MNKLKELWEELRSVLSGRGARLLDSLFPPLVFLLANPILGADVALWSAVGVAGAFTVYRLFRKDSLVYALGGLGGTALAALFVKLSGSGSGYFLPGFASGALTVLLCILSVLFSRPVAAWSSFITRRWTLAWYWHPQVLPAYNEVTIFWAVAFAARLVLQFRLYQQNDLNALGTVTVLLGWPYIILILVISYLYGIWRLGRLQGPSVEEFKANTPPPWQGQKRGF